VVIGKGAAYAQADSALRAFIDTTRLPFLATAMGRGVVPDRYWGLIPSAIAIAIACVINNPFAVVF